MRCSSNESHPALRIITVIALTVVVLFLSTQPANADQIQDDSIDLNALSRTEVSITALGQSYDLLDEFVDAEEAIALFTLNYPNFLERATAYGLPELTVETASAYKTYTSSVETSCSVDDLGEILAFFDILENRQENEAIEDEIRSLESLVSSTVMPVEDALSQVEKVLPISNGQSTITVIPLNSGINLSAARSYAEKYATSYNTTYGYEKSWLILDADCTNFASQILHAGGISMVYNSSTASGWWWRAIGDRSLSWIQANTFANYMGSGYNNTSWSSFVSNVRAGDFIAYDAGDDGSIDHIGFVHSKSGGELYIAQHSSDYLKWSDDSGWPNIDGRYYRIRR